MIRTCLSHDASRPANTIQRRAYYYPPVSWTELQERFQRWAERTEVRIVNVKLLSRRGREKLTNVRRRVRNVGKNFQDNSGNSNEFSKKTALTESPSQLPLPGAYLNRERFGELHQRWKTRRKQQVAGWKSRFVNRRETLGLGYQRWKGKRKDQYQGWKDRSLLRTKQILLKEYSKPEWFDALGRPLTSKDLTGRYLNPWQSQSTNGVHSISTLISWRFKRLQRQFREISNYLLKSSTSSSLSSPPTSCALPKSTDPPPELPIPDPDGNVQLTWIGHATCWIQMNGLTIITDPMFSVRAGPFQANIFNWFPIGVPRELPPSHTAQELVDHTPDNKIDVCFITHDHYDHMDWGSVNQLNGKVRLWVVPIGIKNWLSQWCGVSPDSIVELEWWQQIQISKVGTTVDYVSVDEIQNMEEKAKPRVLTVTCCPASHWGSRHMWDRNIRLWGSFALTSALNDQRVFICGDTGYPDFPLFRQIGDALGPFDLAAIPIGAYEPKEMMKDAHVNPLEAVQIHKDLRSKQSIAIHWGSFRLSEEGLEDPPKDLIKALETEQIDRSSFGTLDHGGTIEGKSYGNDFYKNDPAHLTNEIHDNSEIESKARI